MYCCMIMNFSNRISSQSQPEENREESHETPSTVSIKLFSVTITVGSNSSSSYLGTPEISSTFKKRKVHNRHDDEIVFYDFLGVNRTEKEPFRSGSDMVGDHGYQEPESMLSEDDLSNIKKRKVDDGHANIIFHDFPGVNRSWKEEPVSPRPDGFMGGGGGGGFQEPNPMPPEELWRIKKRLTKSDVSDRLCRLMLSTKQVQEHIFTLWNADLVERLEADTRGVSVAVWDYDTGSDCRLMFKKWRSNKSFVFSNWKENFITRRGLKEGDEIGMFWDRTNSRFGFRVLNRK